MSSPETVRALQERAARAFPAEQVRDADGWWLRHAPSCSWWIGTVLPHAEASAAELVRRVIGAEEFYASHGVAARFQITPSACPAGLDAVLAERGYRHLGLTSLQVAGTAEIQERLPASSLRVRLDDHPTRQWFEVWRAVHSQGDAGRAEWELLGRVAQPSAYACAMIGDEAVAVGRAVADTAWAGVFGMATLPRARGKGAARDVLAALAGWASAYRADRMYLQVERDNIPAFRLYGRTGFTEICGYHYRAAE